MIFATNNIENPVVDIKAGDTIIYSVDGAKKPNRKFTVEGMSRTLGMTDMIGKLGCNIDNDWGSFNCAFKWENGGRIIFEIQ